MGLVLFGMLEHMKGNICKPWKFFIRRAGSDASRIAGGRRDLVPYSGGILDTIPLQTMRMEATAMSITVSPGLLANA